MISTINKFTLIIIIIIYFCHLCKCYVPSARYSTTSVLATGELYFIGGSDESQKCLNDVFSISFTNSFSTSTAPFVELSSIPDEFCSSSSSLAEGGGKIYTFRESNNTLIYSFDVKTKQWSIPKIDGIIPETRSQFQMVSDNENINLYIFGGLNNNITNKNVKFFNDTNIIKTRDTISWNNIMNPGGVIPPYWSDFTATMLSTGEIVYIGGRQSTSPSGTTITFAKMNEIYIFNTISSNWEIINAGGNAPDPRIGHSAILNSNTIIIYGGTSSEDRKTPAMPDLVVLSIDSKPYQWATPDVKNKPSTRSFHSAAIFEGLMIVAFGFITETPGAPPVITNSLNILDLTSLTWKSTYTKNPNHFLSRRLAGIIGGSIGGVVVLIIIIIIIVLLIRSWKKHKNMRGRQHIPSNDLINADQLQI